MSESIPWSEPIQRHHSINEIIPRDENHPFTSVTIQDDEIFYVNPDSAWEVDRLFTDYVFKGEPHKTLIVVFKLKEKEAENGTPTD